MPAGTSRPACGAWRRAGSTAPTRSSSSTTPRPTARRNGRRRLPLGAADRRADQPRLCGRQRRRPGSRPRRRDPAAQPRRVPARPGSPVRPASPISCARPDVGAVGPRLIFPDGSHQVGDAGYEPRPLSILVHAAGLSGRLGLRGLYLASRQARGTGRGGGGLALRRLPAPAPVGDRYHRRPAEPDVPLRRGRRLGLPAARCRMAGRLPAGIAVVHLQGGSGSTRSARWLDGLAADLPAAQRRPAPVVARLLLGSAAARLHPARRSPTGSPARLRGQPDLARKAEDMRRFAGHLRSLRSDRARVTAACG